GKPVDTDPGVIATAKVAEHHRSSAIDLEALGYGHRRGLQLETMVTDFAKTRGARTAEVVKPAPVVFGIERKAVILESHIGAGHLPVQCGDLASRTKDVGSEDDGPVAETDLRVLDGFGARLALSGLMAAVEVSPQARGELFMVLKVAPGNAEVVGFPGE